MRRSRSVCVFCLTRASTISARPALLQRPSQRLLQSSTATPKPAGAAAAALQDDTDEQPTVQSTHRQRPTFMFDDLTDEELAIRNSIRKENEARRAQEEQAARRRKETQETVQREQRKGSLESEWAPQRRQHPRQRRPELLSRDLGRSLPLGEQVASQRDAQSLRSARSSPNAAYWKPSILNDNANSGRPQQTVGWSRGTNGRLSRPQQAGNMQADGNNRWDDKRYERQRSSYQQNLGESDDPSSSISSFRKREAQRDGIFRKVGSESVPEGQRAERGWKHIGRQAAEATPATKDESATYSPYKPLTQASEQEVRPRQPDRDFQSRQRQYKDGRYVGFDDKPEALDRPSRARPQEQLTPPKPRFGVDRAPAEQTKWASTRRYDVDADEEELARSGKSDRLARKQDRRRGGMGSRRKGQDWDEEEDEAAAKKERAQQRKLERQAKKTKEAAPTPIILPEYISIGNLATALKVRVEDFGSKLEDLGFEEMSNDFVIDSETAGLIAAEFNYEPIQPTTAPEEDLVAQPVPDDTTYLLNRPPVITIMGHVDHGKTTLLDYLRKSSVAASEHGGITQHIGAFTVEMPSGHTITFLDTPGHAAFLSMRARGANVTDIVILVVAADDSVKPQTIEAIKHAKDARVPIIVAINKIDKPDAAPERVKQDLARYGIEVEDFGGDTQTVLVSGKTGQGMSELEDAAIALADVLDVRADNTGVTEGTVLEAARKASGKVATVLVRRGTLSPGQVLVAGTTWTKVRTLRNEAGATVDSAGPGVPVEVDGWREQPSAGAEALQAPDEHKARRVVQLRLEREESVKMAADVAAVNEARRAEEARREAELRAEELAKRGEEAEAQEDTGPKIIEVPLVVRADVSGSVEALCAGLLALGNGEVRASLLRSEVGPPSQSDLELAATAKGYIVAFGVPVDGALLNNAAKAGVKVIDGNVIYRVTDEVKGLLEEKLPPRLEKRVTGEADVAMEFEIGLGGRKKLKVAGCRVRNGVVARSSRVRVLRGGREVYDGTLHTLKNQKKDVTEMRKGSECGLSFDGFEDFLPKDAVQCYEVITEKRTL